MKRFRVRPGRHSFENADTIVKASMLIVVGGMLWFGYFHFFGGGKLEDYERIQSGMKAIPGIEVLKTGGRDEGVVLTDVYASFRVEAGGEVTLSGLRPSSFDALEHELLLRVGDWGIATVKIYPDKSEDAERVRYIHGIYVGRDADYLSSTAGKEIRRLSDFGQHYPDLNEYILSLPEFGGRTMDTEFIKAHAQRRKNKWGLTGHHYAVRYRFRTTYLGTDEHDFAGQVESRPAVSAATIAAFASLD